MPQSDPPSLVDDAGKTSSQVRQTIGLGVAALLAIGATVVVLTILQRSTDHWVEHTRDSATLGRKANRLLGVVDSAQKALAADSTRKSTVPVGAAQLHQDVDTLVAITSANPAHHALALQYRRAVQRWEDATAQAKPGERGARAGVSAANALLDSAKAWGDSLIGAEDAEFGRRLRSQDRTQVIALVTISVEALIVLLVLTRMARQIMRQWRALEKRSADLSAAIAEENASRARADALAGQKARLAAFLDAAMNSVPVGMAFLDRDQRVLRVNTALSTLTGRPMEDHVGETMAEIVPSIAGQMEPVLARVMETRQPAVNLPFTVQRAGGATANVLASFYPIVTERHELLGLGAAVLDVTEQHQLEVQLLQVQKMEAIGRLARGITHDFNNLLSVIRASISLIDQNGDVRESRDDVEQIRAAADRAFVLTRQLLSFSREEMQSPEELAIGPVIARMREMIQRLLGGGVSVETSLAAVEPLVRIDPGQLEQIVMNLAINAKDAMNGAGTLTLGTDTVTLPLRGPQLQPIPADAAPGHYVVVIVRDTGRGMEEATLARIFEPFFTTKEPGEGTGLGLATVYGIVRRAHGYVTVTSRPGAGTEFRVFLPAMDAPSARQ